MEGGNEKRNEPYIRYGEVSIGISNAPVRHKQLQSAGSASKLTAVVQASQGLFLRNICSCSGTAGTQNAHELARSDKTHNCRKKTQEILSASPRRKFSVPRLSYI
jgi:hypothetical protein